MLIYISFLDTRVCPLSKHLTPLLSGKGFPFQILHCQLKKFKYVKCHVILASRSKVMDLCSKIFNSAPLCSVIIMCMQRN